MREVIDGKDLGWLIQEYPAGAITIYVDSPVTLSREPLVRLRQLKQQAKDQLIQQDGAEANLIALEQGLHELGKSIQAHPGRQWAMFCSVELCRIYELPYPVNQRLVIAERFYIEPLIPLINNNQAFFILALNQHQTRLLAADRYRYERVELPQLPPTVERANWFRDTTRERVGRTSGLMRPGSTHGEGDDMRAPHPEFLEYLRAVARAVSEHLNSRREPLLVVSEERAASAYRQVNRYRHLHSQDIITNASHLSDAEAWTLAHQCLEEAADTDPAQVALDDLGQLNSQQPDRLSTYLPDIVEAAQAGRVGRLLYDCSAPFIQTAAGLYEQLPSPKATDTMDEQYLLLNEAIAATLGSGGEVISLVDTRFAGRSPVAAILRY